MKDNPLGNIISIAIFLAAVVLGGWYFYAHQLAAPVAGTQSASGTTP